MTAPEIQVRRGSASTTNVCATSSGWAWVAAGMVVHHDDRRGVALYGCPEKLTDPHMRGVERTLAHRVNIDLSVAGIEQDHPQVLLGQTLHLVAHQVSRLGR